MVAHPTKTAMKLLLLLCSIRTSESFGLSAAPTLTAHRPPRNEIRHHGRQRHDYYVVTKLSAGSGGSRDDEASNHGGSDLKALLPTPRKRTLKLDKFGRRVHDLTDDGTAKYSKASSGGGGPATTSIPPEEEDGTTTTGAAKSPKEMAADASSADFGREVKFSSDLKALLPTQKMRFLQLDKFGRRVQRMEDDGTVNMKKEPTKKRDETPSSKGSDDTDVETPKAPIVDDEPTVVTSPSLASLLGKKEKRSESPNKMNSDAILAEGDSSVDLKELLPKQKMRFMKLDKFGRRVQQMEDDGTVNMKKEPAASAPEDSSKEAAAMDLDNTSENDPSDTVENQNYQSLKDLLPTSRATWTKLDVKGASVADDRRTNTKEKKPDSNVVSDRSGSGLKDLLPKRAMWTKLDFHGASVVDERRTQKKSGNAITRIGFNEGQYSNLKTLLPERTVTWKKTQVLSSGSAPIISENVRGLREERQQAMKEEVMASSAARDRSASSDVDEDEENSDANAIRLSEDAKGYTNLKDLLPEKKMTWR